MRLVDLLPRSLRVVAGRRSSLPCGLFHELLIRCLSPSYWSEGMGSGSRQKLNCLFSSGTKLHTITSAACCWSNTSSGTMMWITEAIVKAGFGGTGKAAFFPFPLLFGATLIWKNSHAYFTMFCTSLSISHFIFSFCSGLFLFDSSPRDLKAAELWVQFSEVLFPNWKDIRIACVWQTQPILFLFQWFC